MTDDWHAVMRRATSLDGGATGVPMLLALADERTAPAQPVPAGGQAWAEDGSALADRLAQARAALAPGAHDGDLAVLAVLLATVAYADIGIEPTDDPVRR